MLIIEVFQKIIFTILFIKWLGHNSISRLRILPSLIFKNGYMKIYLIINKKDLLKLWEKLIIQILF